MNTKIVMTLSAIFLGAGGVLLTFIPDFVLSSLKIDVNNMTLMVMQILGALYFAFGMLNWMTKSSLIGGIYNRPVAVANFTHFLIVGLALIKGLILNPDSPYLIWILGTIYSLFGISFIVILFRHPINEKMPI